MNTIGIITYHHYYNYGTMLQALALQRKIEQLGYKAELIDFKQDNSLSKYELLKLRIKRLPIYIKEKKKYRALAEAKRNIKYKEELFEQFYKKHLKVGNVQYINTQQLIEDPPHYDGYVVGSDQTWNPYVANAPEAFFLPFVENNKKKGSYGPSIAVKSLPREKEKEYKEKLSGFSFLSCREKDGTDLLKKLTKKEVKCVLDPTLLLTAEDWNQFCDHKVTIEPYILVYLLGERLEYRKIVDEIQKLTKWKVISLPATYLEMENANYEKVWGGPQEFLSLIKNASLICTDSFHGTMFSINFSKSFFAFCKNNDSEETSENSRLYNALNMFGLSDRIIHNAEKINIENISIDYDKVIPILQEQRKASIEYLENMLYEITKG